MRHIFLLLLLLLQVRLKNTSLDKIMKSMFATILLMHYVNYLKIAREKKNSFVFQRKTRFILSTQHLFYYISFW